jgi:hypothetical protein
VCEREKDPFLKYDATLCVCDDVLRGRLQSSFLPSAIAAGLRRRRRPPSLLLLRVAAATTAATRLARALVVRRLQLAVVRHERVLLHVATDRACGWLVVFGVVGGRGGVV